MLFYYQKESASGETGGLAGYDKGTFPEYFCSTGKKKVYIGSNWKTVSWNSKKWATQNATFRTGYAILERTIDKHGQFLLPASLEWIPGGPTPG